MAVNGIVKVFLTTSLALSVRLVRPRISVLTSNQGQGIDVGPQETSRTDG
jgi:hypothetical protein